MFEQVQEEIIMLNKYRAYDIKKKEYIEIIGFYIFGSKITLWFLDSEGHPDYGDYHIDGIILEQYINRKDDKGQGCYAGDIISTGGYSGWKIVWHHDGWRMQQGDRIENIQFIPDHFNIYSNIHKE